MQQPDEDTFGEPLCVLYVVSPFTVCRNIHAGVRASAGVIGKNASQERKRHAVGLLEVRGSFVKGLDGSRRSHQPVSGFAGKADACLSFFPFLFRENVGKPLSQRFLSLSGLYGDLLSPLTSGSFP